MKKDGVRSLQGTLRAAGSSRDRDEAWDRASPSGFLESIPLGPAISDFWLPGQRENPSQLLDHRGQGSFVRAALGPWRVITAGPLCPAGLVSGSTSLDPVLTSTGKIRPDVLPLFSCLPEIEFWGKCLCSPGRWHSWSQCCPGHQKATGLIPGQGTYLGCRVDPRSLPPTVRT